MIAPDPTVPRTVYDPLKLNPGVQELRRQMDAGEELDPTKAMTALMHSQGKVWEEFEWVKEVPYSQANWEGDGA